MSTTYALINEQGRMIGSGILSACPVKLPPGQRLSVVLCYYDQDFSRRAEEHYDGDGYNVVVINNEAKSLGCQHYITVIGDNLTAVMKVSDRFAHQYGGAVDRDLDFPLRYSMPEIRGFWKRIKFFYWDYLICGQTKPKQNDSDEDIDLIEND